MFSLVKSILLKIITATVVLIVYLYGIPIKDRSLFLLKKKIPQVSTFSQAILVSSKSTFDLRITKCLSLVVEP